VLTDKSLFGNVSGIGDADDVRLLLLIIIIIIAEKYY